MKSIAFSSDLTLQSEAGTVTIVTQSDTVYITVSDWSTFILLLRTVKAHVPLSLNKVRRKTQFLDQPLRLSVKGKQVVTVQKGKLRSFGFIPLVRAIFLYLTR